MVSIGSLALCQTHFKQVPVFSAFPSSSYLLVNMGCALAIVYQVHSLYVPTKNRSPSWGHFWESLVIYSTLEIGQNHLSIEGQCDHHSPYICPFGCVSGNTQTHTQIDTQTMSKLLHPSMTLGVKIQRIDN